MFETESVRPKSIQQIGYKLRTSALNNSKVADVIDKEVRFDKPDTFEDNFRRVMRSQAAHYRASPMEERDRLFSAEDVRRGHKRQA